MSERRQSSEVTGVWCVMQVPKKQCKKLNRKYLSNLEVVVLLENLDAMLLVKRLDIKNTLQPPKHTYFVSFIAQRRDRGKVSIPASTLCPRNSAGRSCLPGDT